MSASSRKVWVARTDASQTSASRGISSRRTTSIRGSNSSAGRTAGVGTLIRRPTHAPQGSVVAPRVADPSTPVGRFGQSRLDRNMGAGTSVKPESRRNFVTRQ